MKGVIVEIKNEYAAVLTEDGTIIKIRRKCAVGDTIELTDRDLSVSGRGRMIRFVRTAAIAVAVILIVLGASGGYYFTATAASTVTVHSPDGDITLSLNRLDRVIKVEAAGSLREDTVQTLYEDGIRNSLLPDALEKTSKVFEETGTDTEATAFAIDIETKSQSKYETLKNQAEEKGFVIGSGITEAAEDHTEQQNPGGQLEPAPDAQPSGDQNPGKQEEPNLNAISSDQQGPDMQAEPDPDAQSSGQQGPDMQAEPDPDAQSSGQQGPDMQAEPDPDVQSSGQQSPDGQTEPAPAAQSSGDQNPGMQAEQGANGQSSEQQRPDDQQAPGDSTGGQGPAR